MKNHGIIKSLDVLLVAIGTSIAMLLSSCQDFDPSNDEIIVKKSFENNFKKTFGEIDPNQSWDLSKTMPRTKKYDIYSETGTRAITGYRDATSTEISDLIDQPDDITKVTNKTTWEGWYEVQDATLDWLDNTLKESENNTSLGSPFTLVPPSNQFAIIPIYQGECGMIWDLHLVDKAAGIDYNIWSQSTGIWKYQNHQWSKPGNTWNTVSTINADRIMSRPILIDGNAISGHEFFLYLDITSGQTKATGGFGDYAETGTAQRSDEGMMLSLKCPIPTNLDAFTGEMESLVMVVGCEDANLADSDWDLNDVVFLIVGYPLIPDKIEHYFKRYLCEDLGNTYDFDFNDIVVDANQTSYFTASLDKTVTPYEIKYTENTAKQTQTATIAHLCGELPFQVTIGNTVFPAVTDPTDQEQTLEELGQETTTRADGWEPNVTKTITGWDKENNNINIKVAKNPKDAIILTSAFGADEVTEENEEKHIYKINFPQDGEAPLIIAVDRTVEWMDEFVHIPETWWKEGKFYEKEEEESQEWDYNTAATLTYADNGDAILSSNPTVLGSYTQINDFYNQTVGHALLLQAFDQGYTKINISFESTENGQYTLRPGQGWEELHTDTFNSSSITIDLLDYRGIIRNMNGLRIELWLYDNSGKITGITMSK